MAEPMKKLYVKDYMSPRLVTLLPDMEVVRASRKMMTHDVTGAPVVDDTGKLVGLLTEKDCMKVVLNAVYHGEFGGLVRDFMATDIEVMHVDESPSRSEGEGPVRVARQPVATPDHRR